MRVIVVMAMMVAITMKMTKMRMARMLMTRMKMASIRTKAEIMIIMINYHDNDRLV